MQKTNLCVSYYLAAILALYMHQFCVARTFNKLRNKNTHTLFEVSFDQYYACAKDVS